MFCNKPLQPINQIIVFIKQVIACKVIFHPSCATLQRTRDQNDQKLSSLAQEAVEEARGSFRVRHVIQHL